MQSNQKIFKFKVVQLVAVVVAAAAAAEEEEVRRLVVRSLLQTFQMGWARRLL